MYQTKPFGELVARVLLALFLTTCGVPPDKQDVHQLSIAVAASLVLPLQQLVEVYQEKTGVSVVVIGGSSGKLAAQVAAGAPYQLFLSADTEYPEALVKQGLTKGHVTVFARGRLAFFVKKPVTTENLSVFTQTQISTIAIPNPAVAPYGRAAVQAFKKAGLYEQLKTKFVYGESVGQVNQFLHSGVVDGGITALTFSKMEQQDYLVNSVDTALYSPIQHGAVLLKSADEQAEGFFAFLRSSEGQKILAQYGLE